MKKILTTLALAAVIIFAGCTDLDDIYDKLDILKKENKEQADRLNDHEARLKALENLVNTVNTDIENLKKVTEVLEKKISIVSYIELPDGSGYELLMSDNTKITLKHGATGAKGDKGDKGDQGDKPIIGVKPFGDDNRLYWTIDGEWLLDASLNKVPATGAKGEQGEQGEQGEKGDPGVTPILRVNTTGNWEMSTDQGKTWQEVKDSGGNPVKAIGKDGKDGKDGKNGKDGIDGIDGKDGKDGKDGVDGKDGTTPDLTITETADTIIITLNGTSYTLPKAPPLNPLSLVAEYNVNPAGTGFVTSLTDCTVSGYFNFDDAVAQFTNITIGGKQYHLPSIEEWHSIVPRNWYIHFTETKSHDDISETVTVQGTSITMTSDFRAEGNGVAYALRYKGTDMISAWRYEYIENGNNTHMKITSRSLKGQMGVTVDDIAKPAFWSANAWNDVIRHFPASGEYEDDSFYGVGTKSSFWSSSPNGSSQALNIYFGSGFASPNYISNRINGFSVRLFASGGDTPPEKAFNPLSLVTKYNVNPAGDGFVTSLTDCTVSGYFSFKEADSKFTPITIGGKQYHLPDTREWCSIVPWGWYVLFKETESYNDISETVTVQGTSITMTSDFRTGVSGVSYALRYKGTDLVSAWRYEYIENGNNTHMKITSRSLKGQTGVTVEDIAKPAFWSANAWNDVTRHFPASGRYKNGSLNNVGTYGYFWSSLPYNNSNAWYMYFYSDHAFSRDFNYHYNYISVRLFSSGD